MQNICFVCEGNTCRSPFAEKLFSKLLKDANITDFKVTSCGINADTTKSINNNMVVLLKRHKIYVRTKKAKKLTKNMLTKIDMFVTMTKYQKQFIKSDKVVSFGELVGEEDILDPYGQDFTVYENTANQIEYYCNKLLNKIIKLKGNNV